MKIDNLENKCLWQVQAEKKNYRGVTLSDNDKKCLNCKKYCQDAILYNPIKKDVYYSQR